MSTLVKLGIRANIVCILGMIITGVAVYLLGYGAWRVAGIPIFFIFVVFTFAALIISCLQNLVFKPVLSGQAARLAKQGMLFAGEVMAANEIAFANEVIDAKNKHERTRYIAGGVLGIIAYFALGMNVGSPVAEIAALAVLLLGPTVFGMLMQGSLVKMRTLNPELFDSAIELYSAAHHASFDASVIA